MKKSILILVVFLFTGIQMTVGAQNVAADSNIVAATETVSAETTQSGLSYVEESLMNPSPQAEIQIMEVLQQFPGLNTTDLARRLPYPRHYIQAVLSELRGICVKNNGVGWQQMDLDEAEDITVAKPETPPVPIAAPKAAPPLSEHCFVRSVSPLVKLIADYEASRLDRPLLS